MPVERISAAGWAPSRSPSGPGVSRARCTREGIRINTFMLDANSHLRTFVEKLTQMNHGRAFFTTPETLGDYVLVDFIDQKRAMKNRRAG